MGPDARADPARAAADAEGAGVEELTVLSVACL